MKTSIVVAALIRNGNSILLVCQQGPDDPAPSWALPGGAVEDGELLTDALLREVREEIGLEVTRIGGLLYTLQSVNSAGSYQSVVFVFEIAEWRGALAAADPDALILDARFLIREEAIERLRELPWSSMRGPILAYLRGEAAPGALWFYRAGADGTERLSSFSS